MGAFSNMGCAAGAAGVRCGWAPASSLAAPACWAAARCGSRPGPLLSLCLLGPGLLGLRPLLQRGQRGLDVPAHPRCGQHPEQPGGAAFHLHALGHPDLATGQRLDDVVEDHPAERQRTLADPAPAATAEVIANVPPSALCFLPRPEVPGWNSPSIWAVSLLTCSSGQRAT